jgi:hypothetical protein
VAQEQAHLPSPAPGRRRNRVAGPPNSGVLEQEGPSPAASRTGRIPTRTPGRATRPRTPGRPAPPVGRPQHQGQHAVSGGFVTQKDWEVPAGEAAALFRELAEDGLLELPDGAARFPAHSVTVVCGRWHTTTSLSAMPEKLLKRLRPYLEHAHSALWKAKQMRPRDPLPDDRRPDRVTWVYSPDRKGWGDHRHFTLTITCEGSVKYTSEVWKEGGMKPDRVPVAEEWTIPTAEAEKVLAGLVEDGLLEGDKVVGGSAAYPRYWWEAKSGRWTASGISNQNLDRIVARLRPYLEKADPEEWKKAPKK